MKKKTRTIYFCDCGRMFFDEKTMTWEDSMADDIAEKEEPAKLSKVCPNCKERLLESPISKDSNDFIVVGFPDIPGQITYVSPDNT